MAINPVTEAVAKALWTALRTKPKYALVPTYDDLDDEMKGLCRDDAKLVIDMLAKENVWVYWKDPQFG